MKIYYTIDDSAVGAPLLWLDSGGKKNQTTDRASFFATHQNTVFLARKEFEKKQRQAAQDRAKLLAWKEWAI